MRSCAHFAQVLVLGVPEPFKKAPQAARCLRVCGATPLRCGAKPHRYLQVLRVAQLMRGVQPHRILPALRFAQLLRGCGTWPSLPHRCGAALWSLGRGASALPCCCGFPPSEVASLSAFRLLQVPARRSRAKGGKRRGSYIYIYIYIYILFC